MFVVIDQRVKLSCSRDSPLCPHSSCCRTLKTVMKTSFHLANKAFCLACAGFCLLPKRLDALYRRWKQHLWISSDLANINICPRWMAEAWDSCWLTDNWFSFWSSIVSQQRVMCDETLICVTLFIFSDSVQKPDCCVSLILVVFQNSTWHFEGNTTSISYINMFSMKNKSNNVFVWFITLQLMPLVTQSLRLHDVRMFTR